MTNKNNRNFAYSFLFFILTNIAMYFNPDKTRELIFSLPSDIKSKILFSDLFPTFEHAINSIIILFFIFLVCSMYFSIKFINKEPNSKKLLGVIPKSIFGFFAFVPIVMCLIYIKMILFVVFVS